MSEINYDKLLDDWAEISLKESDELENKASNEKNYNTYKCGKIKGIAEGYRMAIVKLNLMEKKWKHKII